METRLSTGTLIDGTFEIVEVLGSGSMAAVYLAKHLTLHQMVAVKVLNDLKASESDAVKRFQSEAIAIAKLDHEHIVKILKTGTWNDLPYICMEHLDGQTLEHAIKGGPIEPAEVKRIGIEICDALSHAHESGVIHRDVKPSNILFSKSKASKLTDFGIAKIIHQDNQGLTATGEILGTPAYMSPEQILNKAVDARADIYSLACVLYQCLSGEPPFVGESAYLIAQSQLSTTPKLTQQFGGLNKVLLKALAKSPEDRYQSAIEFKNALQSAQSGMSSGAAKNKSEKVYKTTIAAAAGVILLGGLAAAFNHHNGQTSKIENNNAKTSLVSSKSVSLENFQTIVAKLKKSDDEAEKAKVLKDAYSFIESPGAKSIPRATRLNIQHEFATLLFNHHLSKPALAIFKEVLWDLEKNDLPKTSSKTEERFGRSNLLNCQSKAVEISYKQGELTEAKSLYKELQRDATSDSPALLKAAILLGDKKTITKMANQKPGSENSAVKIANVLLENDLIDELGGFLKLSLKPIKQIEFYTENDADLLIVLAKYALLTNDQRQAVELIRKFSAAKTPLITQEKKGPILERGVEILCVAGELKEAKEMLTSMNLPDGPTAIFKSISGAVITDANAEVTLASLQGDRKFQSARELADYVLASPRYSDATKARCAQIRSKNTSSSAVYAYYVSLARTYSRKLADDKGNSHTKLLMDYCYADRIKYLHLHSLAEPIFLTILSKNGLSKAQASDKTYVEISLANELQILTIRKDRKKAEGLLKQHLPNLHNPTDIYVFIPLLIDLKDETSVKTMIAECTHLHDLVWTAERSLDLGRLDLALLCLDRISELPPEVDTLYHHNMRSCCRTIVGALCALYVGDTKNAKEYFTENAKSPEGLDDFSKTYSVLNALSS